MEKQKKTVTEIIDDFTDDEILINILPVDICTGQRLDYGSKWKFYTSEDE